MWTCPLCNQQFVKNQQVHSCGDKALTDFLQGKSAHTIALFRHFATCYQEIGKVTIHPTKSMIAFAAKKRIAYVTRLGKDFADIVFPFQQSYDDNLCFHKIAKVPGQLQFNHHFRMYRQEDVNDEVRYFMQLAYDLSL